MHHCFFRPSPPNFFMSLQFVHSPQLSSTQPSHMQCSRFFPNKVILKVMLKSLYTVFYVPSFNGLVSWDTDDLSCRDVSNCLRVFTAVVTFGLIKSWRMKIQINYSRTTKRCTLHNLSAFLSTLFIVYVCHVFPTCSEEYL